jgi:hypothetical protein
MDKSPSPDASPAAWRDDLIRELKRRKIPRAWQVRLLEELDDHLSDLKEETMDTNAGNVNACPQPSTEARLGVPREIAEAASAEYRRLGFFARRPVVTYVVGPLLIVPAAFVAFVVFVGVVMALVGLGLDGIMWLMGAQPPDITNDTANGLVRAAVFGMRFLPFGFLAWIFCHLTRRHSRGWRCVLSACTIVAVYAGLLSVTMQAFTEYQSGLLTMGVVVPPKSINLLQAAVPLAVGLLFIWRTTARRTGPELPCTDATA